MRQADLARSLKYTKIQNKNSYNASVEKSDCEIKFIFVRPKTRSKT